MIENINKNWYIEVNDFNKYILAEWKDKQFYDEPLILCDGKLNYEFIESDGAGSRNEEHLINIGLKKITTEQFIKHILKQDIPNKETMDYLIDFLLKLNIS